MAGKIKGITIEIGGDTTKLGKAIEEVNKKSKSLQTELRGVNSLLKMDPSNINLIKQKQDLLNESITATKEKLTTLKSTQKQVQDQFDKGEITAEQYRDFQREIASTEQKLARLTAEAKEFGANIDASLISASVKVEEFGQKAESAGKKLLPVTAGITAVGAAGVAAFNEVDKGADNVIKATGAVGKAAEELKESYENVASNVVGNFEGIGNALGEVNTRFGYTGDQLEECTEKFLKFAEITGSDATTSVQLVARAMGDAGIEADEYNSVLDSLAVAAQASGIGVDKLTENLTKYGAPMRALGYDTAESIAIFASWEKAGVNTEIAFSGMKKAISTFSAEGKDAKVEFKKVLDEIAACPDIASATTKAIEVFGTKAGPDLADAIQGGRFEFSEMLDIIESADGVVDGTFDELVDGGYEAQLAMQNAKLAMSGIGETIMSILAPILQSISNKLREFKAWWDSLGAGMQKAIVIIAGVVAAVGPLLILIGKMASGVAAMIKVFGTIKTVIMTVKGAFVALNAVMLANPIGLIIAAIVALIAIFVVLWNNCEGFREFWINLWNIIVEKAKESWESIKVIFSVVGEFFTETWQSIVEAFSNAKEWFGEKFTSAWNSIVNAFLGVGEFFTNIWNIITTAFNDTVNWFSNKFTDAWNSVKNVFSTVGEFFSGIWTIIKNQFTNIGTAIGDAVGGAFKNVVNSILGYAQKTINGFINSINGAIGFINKIPGVNISKIGTLDIPMMAKGGTLHEGQAIVAEAGPEMIQLVNGKAVVTPLSSKSKNTAIEGSKNLNLNKNDDKPFVIKNYTMLDGKVVAESTNKELGNATKLGGRGVLVPNV